MAQLHGHFQHCTHGISGWSLQISNDRYTTTNVMQLGWVKHSFLHSIPFFSKVSWLRKVHSSNKIYIIAFSDVGAFGSVSDCVWNFIELELRVELKNYSISVFLVCTSCSICMFFITNKTVLHTITNCTSYAPFITENVTPVEFCRILQI